MTKTFTQFSSIVLTLLVVAFFATISTAQASTDWDVSGNWVFDYYYGGSNLHDMTLTQDENGVLTGTGGAFSGILPYAYPWTIVSGSVVDDAITFTADYVNLDCSFTVEGTIANDGSMGGTWTDDCDGPRAGTWETTAGVATKDTDNDGILNTEDYCSSTEEEDNFEEFGNAKGRYEWDGVKWQSSGKGDKKFYEELDMEYTHGCSGRQILDSMSEDLDEDFGGHYKFGLSKSILEAWHEGAYYVGPTLRDTVVIDSALIGGADSVWVLEDEADYFLRSSGTWTNRPGETVDTKYTTMDGWATQSDAPAGVYPEELLDLQVDEQFVDWGAYSNVHEYEIAYSPSVDGTLNLRVFDGDAGTNTPDPSWYGDNVGSLTVEIWEDLWIDLW